MDVSKGAHIGIEVHGTVMKKYWRSKGKTKVTTGRRMYKPDNALYAEGNKVLKEKEKESMKKTINLLNEVVKMGFSREKALRDIDASLDEELGTENRKPLMEEEIPNQLYEDILFGFRCEAEEP